MLFFKIDLYQIMTNVAHGQKTVEIYLLRQQSDLLTCVKSRLECIPFRKRYGRK